MYQSVIKAFLRHVKKNYLFFQMNILGLVVGITVCMFIFRYGIHELSYDDFNTRVKDIYRVSLSIEDKGEVKLHTAESFLGTGPLFTEEFPEVEKFTRLSTVREEVNIIYQDKKFRERDNIYYADEAFFDVFTVPFKSGNPKTALSKPNHVVISASLAKKIFGEEDPINQNVVIEPSLPSTSEESTYVVSGVFEDLPQNSHMQFDLLVSNVNFLLGDRFKERWGSWVFYTYILLKPDAAIMDISKRLPEVVDRNIHAGMPEEMTARAKFHLQPIEDIHMYSDLTYELFGHEKNGGKGEIIWMLILGALFILVIALINYINLATAQALDRSLEIGLRKLNGANKFHLGTQFLIEASFVHFVSFLISVIIFYLLLPGFSSFVNVNLVDFSWYLELKFWLILLASFVLMTFVAALYPVLIFSSFKPDLLLKGQLKRSKFGSSFRKGLVTIQASLALLFIFGTLVIFAQVDFMRQQNLGIDINQTLVVKGPSIKDEAGQNRTRVFMDQIKNYPEILDVTHSNSTPGVDRLSYTTMGVVLQSKSTEDNVALVNNTFHMNRVDLNYLSYLGAEIIAGRNFIDSDWDNALIVNETTAKTLGFQEPEKIVNEILNVGRYRDMKVVGVVKDFHQVSLKNAVGNYLFMPEKAAIASVLIKTPLRGIESSISAIREEWKKVFNNEPFEYFFLQEHFLNQYRQDELFGKALGLGAMLAIVVAGLGLFGLSTYIVVQRNKEIGMRKVVGASAWSIQLIFIKYFSVLIFFALLIGIPLAYFSAYQWLQSFAYRIELGLSYFLYAILGVVLITFLSISYKVIKASFMLPVDVMRRVD